MYVSFVCEARKLIEAYFDHLVARLPSSAKNVIQGLLLVKKILCFSQDRLEDSWHWYDRKWWGRLVQSWTYPAAALWGWL